MACYNSNCYLPQPPRAWSRVQNSCSLVTDTNTNLFAEKMNMLQKGNILQYKKNSGNLTKTQKYSLIAQGKWVNRNTTWATQSTRGYTNPNTTSLKRIGNVNIAYDPITLLPIGPTTAKPTCLTPIIINNNVLPSGGGDSSLNPEVLPPPPPPPVNPNNGGTNLPSTPIPTPIAPIVIQDEGILACNIKENICTGETVSTISQQLCNPTSDSDVPGSIQSLCWNDGTPTWYPRQRYVMSNSDNKWPVNATLLSAVKIYPPIITSITSTNTLCQSIFVLSWKQDIFCIPITTYTIFQNDTPIQIVGGNVFSAEITVFNSGTYNYYIISENININSDPSNIVSISVVINLQAPILNTCSSNTPNNITITWSNPDNLCCSITQYKIYYSDGNTTKSKLVNSSQLHYTITGLQPGKTYTCSVSYLCGITESPVSNSLSATPIPYFIATGLYTEYHNNGYSGIAFTTSSEQTITFNYNLHVHLLVVAGGGGGGLQASGGGGQFNQYYGGGGGGGGIYYDTGFNVFATLLYTILVGSKGIGAPNSGTNKGTTGGNSSVTWSTNTILSDGGLGSDGGNGTNLVQTTATYNSGSNAQCYQGGYGGNANASVVDYTTWTSGSASGLISVYLPFISTPTTIYLSGGGGGATLNSITYIPVQPNQIDPSYYNQYGGKSGHGTGGIGMGAYNPNYNGENANSSIINGGFGGGGGGGVGTIADTSPPPPPIWQHFYGGNGGDGVVIMWWANL